MRQDKFSKPRLILYACGVIPAVWLALLLAPCMSGGLIGLVQDGAAALNNPFHIVPCEDSFRTVLIFVLCYGLGIGVYLSTDRNYRRREEHGSAKWGSAQAVRKKYADKKATENKILTQNVAIGLDGRKHRRNLNILVCGGSGAGKTRFFAKPNIMNANTSFVCLDPKGELLRDTGNLLKAKGYDIKEKIDNRCHIGIKAKVLSFLKSTGLIYEDGIMYKCSLQVMDNLRISRVAYTQFKFDQLEHAYSLYLQWCKND